VTSLLLLIPLSVLVLVGAAIALFWAVDRGQYDDLETPALLPLLDRDAKDESSADSADASRRTP
jgi:cbb3-type cytochrome oxidase maturation protein